MYYMYTSITIAYSVILTESVAFPHTPIPATIIKQQEAIKTICLMKENRKLYTNLCYYTV